MTTVSRCVSNQISACEIKKNYIIRFTVYCIVIVWCSENGSKPDFETENTGI